MREVALRYLGEKMGELYLAQTAEWHETAVLVRLTPERWQTVDFAKWGT